MRVALFTASDVRHYALAHFLSFESNISLVKSYHENNYRLENTVAKNIDEKFYLEQHLKERSQSENDIFNCLELTKINQDSQAVPLGWFSTQECLDSVRENNIDIIVVYGSSIIKGRILTLYKDRIINLHMGLSPYYRGSGTNYFPFVNGEPQFVGATIMNMDSGIDTGLILHQFRPLIMPNDSFYQLSARFLSKAFRVLIQLLVNFSKLECTKKQNSELTLKGQIYTTHDFNLDSLKKLKYNFDNKILHKYLEKKEYFDSNVVIISQTIL